MKRFNCRQQGWLEGATLYAKWDTRSECAPLPTRTHPNKNWTLSFCIRHPCKWKWVAKSPDFLNTCHTTGPCGRGHKWQRPQGPVVTPSAMACGVIRRDVTSWVIMRKSWSHDSTMSHWFTAASHHGSSVSSSSLITAATSVCVSTVSAFWPFWENLHVHEERATCGVLWLSYSVCYLQVRDHEFNPWLGWIVLQCCALRQGTWPTCVFSTQE